MSFKRIAEIEREVEKLEIERKSLLKLYENLTPEQRFATVLHDSLCTLNHTDACSWQYETWDNVEKSHSKKRYVRMANDLMDRGYDENVVLELISIINEY